MNKKTLLKLSELQLRIAEVSYNLGEYLLKHFDSVYKTKGE